LSIKLTEANRAIKGMLEKVTPIINKRVDMPKILKAYMENAFFCGQIKTFPCGFCSGWTLISFPPWLSTAGGPLRG